MRKVFPGIKSDHSIIIFRVSSNIVPKRLGFWKFNSNLLYDPHYVKNITYLIQNLKTDTAQMIDKHLQWDYIKTEIRGFTLPYASRKNKERQELKRKFEITLLNIQNDLNEKMSEAKMDEYYSIKEELEKIE